MFVWLHQCPSQGSLGTVSHVCDVLHVWSAPANTKWAFLTWLHHTDNGQTSRSTSSMLSGNDTFISMRGQHCAWGFFHVFSPKQSFYQIESYNQCFSCYLPIHILAPISRNKSGDLSQNLSFPPYVTCMEKNWHKFLI